MAKRFNETGNIRQVDTRTGAPQAAASLADRLSRFSNATSAVASKEATKFAIEEGTKSGQKVKLEREKAESDPGTLVLSRDQFGRPIPNPEEENKGKLKAPKFKESRIIGGVAIDAHNKALRARYMSEQNNDIRDAVSAAAANNPNNILGFNDSIEGYKKGLFANLEPTVRAEVETDFNNMVSSARVKVQAGTIQKQRNENIEGLAASAQSSFDSASSLMRGGDGTSAGEAMLEGVKATHAQVEAGYITAAEGQTRIDEGNKELAEQAHKANADGLYESGGIKAVNDWLTKNEGKPKKGFTPDQWSSVTSQIQTEANRKESRRSAVSSQMAKVAEERIKDYGTAKSLGMPVSKEDETALNILIADNPEFQKVKSVIDDTATFSVMPASQRSQVLNVGKTGSLEDVDLYASMLKADQDINRMSRDDGYSLGVKQGLIEAEPLDMSDPDLFLGRANQAAILSNHYGVEVSPLSDGEASALSDSIPNMTAQEKISLAKTLAVSPAVWGQLDKKNAGQFAMAGATGDDSVMTAIFNGQELLKTGLVKAPKHDEFNDTFNEYVGGVYGTQDKKAILDAVKSHYSATSAGALEGIFDEDDFKSSLDAVTGGVEVVGGNGFWGGSRVELPRGVTGDDFEDYVEDFGPSLVDHFGGVANFTDEEAAEAIQEGELVSVGSNQYGVRVNDTMLFDKKGKPFLFSYDAGLSIDGKAEEEKAKAAEEENPRRTTTRVRSNSAQPDSSVNELTDDEMSAEPTQEQERLFNEQQTYHDRVQENVIARLANLRKKV